MLFYGPPGTGKTTTILNLIKSYQLQHNQSHPELIIHLNASDDRGIDIIRHNICSFVSSNCLFLKGTKFVILDEVDYMTNNAQQALTNLIYNCNNVCFCLICNYISRILDSLQNSFIKLRFDKMPDEEIYNLLQYINKTEKLNYKLNSIKYVKELYKSDIRSMINHLQSNRNSLYINKIINLNILNDITLKIKKASKNDINSSSLTIYKFITNLSNKYEMDNLTFIKYYINYLYRNYLDIINSEVIKMFDFVIHNNEYMKNDILHYFIMRLILLFSS